VRGNWLRVQAYGGKGKQRTEIMIKKSRQKLIVFRGKRVDNMIILK
jgi:hypothetical protein